MDALLRTYGATVGRILIGLLFVFSGFGMVMGGTANTAMYFDSLGLPMSSLLVWLVLAVKFIAGGALILGYKTKEASLALMIFVLLTIFIAHRQFMTDINFSKNLAIIGGLLYIYVYGPGNGWKLNLGNQSQN